MTQNPRRKKRRSMENEVIVSVILLYLFIAVTMLAVHHLQPAGQETVTSSQSPSHEHFAAPALQRQPPAPATATP
ncbi:hypothetical protein AAG565_12015 [Fontimonas sp. SYSU GA230001]|uniref:hypothetical protein n=1 Tax=Fontimonas sp. SYSU GA230001 TaxID=3142450 RepID=UPI0032B3B953